jgi:hypothetical protein
MMIDVALISSSQSKACPLEPLPVYRAASHEVLQPQLRSQCLCCTYCSLLVDRCMQHKLH